MIGTHILFSENMLEEIKGVKKIGGECIQIFVHNRDTKLMKAVKELCQKLEMKIFVHSSYTINLGREWNHNSSMILQLLEEMKLSEGIGAEGIVVHVGKHKEHPLPVGINNMFSSILYILEQTRGMRVRFLLETPAGQGTEMCVKVNEFVNFFNKFKDIEMAKNRVGVCMDTCHVFAAGYMPENYYKTLCRGVGEDMIWLIHLNDSGKGLGERRDFHENIGFGKIGTKNLVLFYKLMQNAGKPMILETPQPGFMKEIKFLKNKN